LRAFTRLPQFIPAINSERLLLGFDKQSEALPRIILLFLAEMHYSETAEI